MVLYIAEKQTDQEEQMNTRNKEGRSEAHVDLLDALKGADVPESEIEAAMQDMQFGPEEKQEIGQN